MKKAKIKLGNSILGFGGLNRLALLEDGWKHGMIVDVVEDRGDRLTVKWGDGKHQNRDVYRHEIEFV